MTKISQYSTDVNITGNDKWIGSDAQNFLITKNFTPNNLASFFNENNVIDIGTSIRYRYQTLLPGEAREQGTISFETEIGPQVNFSAITTFLIAKNTLKGNTVSQYLDFLVDGKVLLSKASNINIFGYYKITSIEPWITNTNFFVVEVDFLAGNGFIYEDLDYLVSLVDKAQDTSTTVWGSITGDIEDQTDLINYISSQITTPTLASVLVEGNTTGGENIVINDADAIQLENSSTLKKGTYDFGADGGISRICGVGFEDMWQSGIRHVFDSNGLIRNSTNGFNIVPDASFDNTLRFKVDSLWTLDNGDTYKCTDASTGAAVWELVNTGTTPTLQDVVETGNRYTGSYGFTEFDTAGNLNLSRNDEEYIVNLGTYSGLEISTSDNNSGLIGIGINQDGSNFVGLTRNSGLGSLAYYSLGNRPDGYYDLATLDDIPTLTSQLTNDVPFLTQDNVVEYPDLASFPVTGVIGTIYIALDTGLFYSWSGSAYVLSSPPNTGITGVGTTNYLPKFTSPTTVGNSKVSQDHAGVSVYINYQGRFLLNGNTFLSIQRGQSQIDFVLGNPGFSQPSIIISDNQTDGFEIQSKGELALKTGATYANEGLRVLSTGKLKFTQTPDTGATSDKLLVRDTSGNVKQIDYPTGGGIPHATASGTDTYTATITGVTAYNDADAYLIRFTNGNTTGATLNINGLGAIPLYRNNDGPLLGGDILAGGEMLCIYNSTLVEFQVIGISPNSLIAYVTNADSVTITKGMPVYAFSGQGDRMTVKRANNIGDATSAQTVGLVLSTSIGVNQKGVIMMQGLLDGLSILPTATWSDGDAVYLGATDGTITNIKPYAPNHLVYLGVVTTASNGAAGRMYVRVQNGYELQELHNVQAQSPSLKDTLWYDNTVSPAQWKTASIPTILGYTPANIASPTFTGTVTTPAIIVSSETASSVAIIDGSNNIKSADTATYPSLTELSYVKGVTSAIQTQLNSKQSALSFTPYKFIQTSQTAHTGTVAETIIGTATINGATFNSTDVMKVLFKTTKPSTIAVYNMRIRINTTNTLVGATQIGFLTVGTANTYALMTRTFDLQGGNLYGYNFASSLASDVLATNTVGNTTAYNTANTLYLFFTIQLGNIADSATPNLCNITN